MVHEDQMFQFEETNPLQIYLSLKIQDQMKNIARKENLFLL